MVSKNVRQSRRAKSNLPLTQQRLGIVGGGVGEPAKKGNKEKAPHGGSVAVVWSAASHRCSSRHGRATPPLCGVAGADVEEEHLTTASTASEAMAMMLRLQRDKADIQMELRQFHRFADEKMALAAEIDQLWALLSPPLSLELPPPPAGLPGLPNLRVVGIRLIGGEGGGLCHRDPSEEGLASPAPPSPPAPPSRRM